MASFLRLHPTDNVVVAVAGLSPGDIVDDVKIIRRIPPGHKAAVRAIKKDEPALKFGQIVENAEKMLAIELLCAAQGLDYRQPLQPARRVGEAHAAVRSLIRPLQEDRVLAPDIEALSRAIRTAGFDAWRA